MYSMWSKRNSVNKKESMGRMDLKDDDNEE